jgi:hypothetical protein
MTLPRRTFLAGAFGAAEVAREPGVVTEEPQRPEDEPGSEPEGV